MLYAELSHFTHSKSKIDLIVNFQNSLDKSSYDWDRELRALKEPVQQYLKTFQVSKPIHKIYQPTLGMQKQNNSLLNAK